MSFVATAANIVFAIFVLFKNPSGRVNQLWCLTILCLVYWGSAEFLLRIIQSPELAAIIVHVGGIGFCILPALFFHFTFEFTQQPRSSFRSVQLMYGIGATICMMQAGGYVTTTASLPWGYTFTPTTLYVPFILWLEACFIIGLRWCWKKLRAATTKREVTQTLLIILGAAVPLSIGSMTDAFLPLAGLEVFRLAIVATTATVTLVSIGVVKYQLMSLTPETTASVILETMGDLVAVTDMRETVRFTNRAFREVLQFGDDVIHVKDFIPANILQDHFPQANKVVNLETEFKRHDGTVFPVLLAVSNIYDKGEVVGIIYVASDISSRVETEKKLRESEEMFRALSEAAPAAIFVYEKDNFLYVNSATEAITGYSKEELMSMPFSLLIHPDMRDLVRKRAEARIRGDEVPSRYEIVIQRKNGENRWLDFAGARIDNMGNSVGIGIAFDISERKAAEERIREQAQLLNKANDAILVLDLEGNVRSWNHAANQLFGWQSKSIAGVHVTKAVQIDEPSTFNTTLSIVRKENQWSGEFHLMHNNSKTLVIQSRWTLIRNDRDEPESVLMISNDITDKKIMEQQFLRVQRLESIGALVGGIAHDLNNILAPVVMGIERLRRLLQQDKIRILDIMDVSARRGISLVKQVLTFARGTEQERKSVNTKFLIEELQKIIQETFPKSITVRSVIQSDIAMISGDFTQMHQILLNLCINARDALPFGGTITIAADNIVERNAVCLAVSDTGVGIPDDIREKIFDPFFTTKSLEKGSGLGLSTVMSIVKTHGGTIDVESIMGKGTTFRIVLPASVEELSTLERSAPSTAPSGHGELILIVDDEVSIVELTKETLTMHHYNIATAINGNDAIDVFKKHPDIDCIIMDLNMPVLDGPGAIRRLKSINPDVPIIATTGYSPSYHDFKPEEYGVAQLLQKPYSQKVLLKALADILASRKIPKP
ncbi:MAG: PAS domain S-box protein [Ignavibacteriales bacterium]|nr:PAS domain S-box protein [Ignavibacteriales bacterium]